MEAEELRVRIASRLNDGDRGDRGWFIITRVHPALSWLKGIAEYIECRGSGSPIGLTDQDYRRLAEVIESDSETPGIQLRRHHLLVMDKPLRLLHRSDGRHWAQISLTELGRELARADDPAEVLEKSLSGIRFAAEPWSPPDRVEQYAQFDVLVYSAALQVLQECDGYIDRNEFDLFLSRIRKDREIAWAVEGVQAYRRLSPKEQQTLLNEVIIRIPSEKVYQNWRDVALHTFSLFSLGTSMVRDGQQLLLTGTWLGKYETTSGEDGPKLRIPEPPEFQSLLTPPAAPAVNAGADGESFVAKVLRSQGWEIAFYTNRRGYGFDLWARRENVAMVVEVKSSLGGLGAVALTPLEYKAAIDYGDNFVLALVEHLDGERPRLRFIQNPASRLNIQQNDTTSYSIARADWLRVASEELVP